MMDVRIDSANLEREFVLAFPDLSEKYQEKLKTFGREKGEELGNYGVFGFVLEPRLKEEVARGVHTKFLERVATFIEKVCRSGDLEAINVLWLEVFRLLLDEPDGLKLLWPMLGDCSKKEIGMAAKKWGKKASLPRKWWQKFRI
jgi:hypothetical protein